MNALQAVKTVCVVIVMLLMLTAGVNAQFTYNTNSDGTINIVSYIGSGGNATIPNTINGLPVTSIGTFAFYDSTDLTYVTIPDSVSSIGDEAFFACNGLTNITMPQKIASIGDYAFAACTNLMAIYFQGNTPSADSTVFFGDNATIYYLPGTSSWSSTFGDMPTALWRLPYPLILDTSPNFGVQSNQFNFTISWATNISVIVEACTNLTNTVWQQLQTNTLTGGTSYFSDPQWVNYPKRFYRLRSP